MMRYDGRPDGALLAGVCAGIARAMKWNVWVLRALFIGFALVKTLAVVLVYLGFALLQQIVPAVQKRAGLRGTSPDSRRPDSRRQDSRRPASRGLGSPELSTHDRRIEELDRRFRKLEERRNQAN